MKKRALIVGTGNIARAHARAYEDPDIAARAEIVAVMDIVPEQARSFAEHHGNPTVYTDLDEALSVEKPDLVHVSTPPDVHAEISMKAMRAGSMVLCEKPLCASLEELDAIQKTEAETGRYCASIFQWRYGSGMQHVKRQIEAGALGRPLVAVCNTLWYRDHAYYAVPWRGKWATELGGPTMGHGIHIMDAFLWLMGPWTEVTAKVGTLDRDIEVEDVSMAIVKFESGAMATVVNSILSPRQETYLRLDFQKGTIEATGLYSVSNDDWKWTAAPSVIDLGAAGSRKAGDDQDDGAAREAQWSMIGPDIPGSHTEQIRAIYNDLESGDRPLTSGDQSRQTLSFLTAIYKSAFTNQTVVTGEIGTDDPFYRSLHGGAAG